MNRTLIAAGIFLALLWTGVTLISLGIPASVCNVLNNITFRFFPDAIQSMQNGFYYDVNNKDMPSTVFFILFSIAFFTYFAISLKMVNGGSAKNTFLFVALFTILFRLILIPGIAVHENDFYRYMWDGKVSSHGVNPYKYAPEDIDGGQGPGAGEQESGVRGQESGKELEILKKLRKENPVYFDRIGHKRVPTIYPPVAQAVFYFSSIIKKDSIFLIKIFLTFFDILTFFIIARILILLGRDPSLAIIYGWSPLVLKEIANSAHYDSVPIFFTMLFIYLLLKTKTAAGTIALAMAGLSKLFSLALLPVYVRKIKWRNVLLFGVLFVLIYFPFFVWGRTGIPGVFEGLRTYASLWAYNGSIFIVAKAIMSCFTESSQLAFNLSKILMGTVMTGIILKLSLKRSSKDIELIYRSFLILTWMFFLSPVADPWYFCWIIPFLCIFPFRSLIIFSWLLIFSYISFRHEMGNIVIGSMEFPVLNLMQYIPFLFIFIIEMGLRKKNKVKYV